MRPSERSTVCAVPMAMFVPMFVVSLVVMLAMVGVAGCRCDAPPAAPDAGVFVPPPPPPPVVDAGADVPDASDAGGTGVRHAKKPAAPTPGAGGGGFKVDGTLAKADAEKVVRAGYAKLRACNPDHKGKVTFRLTVDPRGRVTLGEVVHSTLGGDDVEMCMIRTTRDLKFPASGGESKIDFGMNFGR